MKFPIFFAILIIDLFYSIFCCAQAKVLRTFTQSVYWNDHIDLNTRKQIKLLDNRFINSFKENNTPHLIALYSDALFTKGASLTDALMHKIHPMITTNNYSLLDEYLIINPSIGTKTTVFKSISEDNDYQINFNVHAKETYISLIIYKDGFDDLLLTCFYCKFKNKWKLDDFLIGKYKLIGKTAVDLYNQAKKEYINNDLIDATKDIGLSEQIGAPAKEVFIYFKLPEMKSFAAKLQKEVR